MAKREKSSLEIFFKELKGIRVLTREEEVALARRVRQGDERARKEFIEANLKLVVSVARRKFGMCGVPLEDLIDEGVFGLKRAIEKFKLEKGCRFSTYAVYWIKQAMATLIDQKEIIRIPGYVSEKIWRVKRIESDAKKIGEELTEEEKAARAGLPIRHLKKILRAKEIRIVSPVYPQEGEIESFIEILPDDEPSPLEAVLQAEFIWHLKEATDTVLLKREREILQLRIEYEKRLREVGKKYGLTRERIRQIQKQAIEKLRAQMQKRENATVPAAEKKTKIS